MHGANAQRMPVPATSSAVTRSARSTSFGIVRRAQADVVRKNHRAIDVVVAVDGVNAVEQRNFQPRLQRLILKFRDEIQPGLRGIAVRRIGTAAAQDGAEKIFLHVGLVLQRAGIHLHHLADFFVERHLREQRVNLLLKICRQGVSARRCHRQACSQNQNRSAWKFWGR